MARYYDPDVSIGIIKETVEGTTPATPSFLTFPRVSQTIERVSDTITSAILQPNCSAGATRVTNRRAEGSIETEFFRHATHKLLLENLMRNTFSSTTLKAGSIDSSFTLEKKFGGASPLYYRYTGCKVRAFNLSVEGGNATASYDILGLSPSDPASTIITGATYGAAATTQPFGYEDFTVTIGAMTFVPRKLDMVIEQGREVEGRLGSSTPRGVATSGRRNVKLTLEIYKEDASFDAANKNVPQAVLVTIGSGVNGYSFSIPSAYLSDPKSSAGDTSLLETIELTAAYDGTALSDLVITELA